MRYTRDKIEVTFGIVNKTLVEKVIPINGFEYAADGYPDKNEPREGLEWKPYNEERLTEKDAYFWFRGKVTIPKSEKGTVTKFRITTGHENQDVSCRPQILLFTDGEPTHVFDSQHHTCILPEGEHELLISFYTIPDFNEFTYYIPQHCVFKPQLDVVRENVEELIYDMTVLMQAHDVCAEGSFEQAELLNVLDRACLELDLRYPGSADYLESVDRAHAILKEYYDKFAENPKSEVLNIIGHSHLDVAWLWRICQGYEKAQRTLSNAVKLFEQYPDFKFMFTQPALLEKVKEKDPELFKKLQKYAREGRFIPDGAMWVEPDMNLPSGESLVRQLIWGKRFIRENFGVESKTLWLPDVFGYSASLPQILKKAGVDNFYTTKISWNDTNLFPHTFFKWEGIDGTDIWAVTHSHMGTAISPKGVKASLSSKKDKRYVSSNLYTFGHGDGGGGPTEKILEHYERMKNGLPGLPSLKMTSPEEYFENTSREFKDSADKLRDYPRWVGELYLEFHRGTFTSIAFIKNANRRAEYLCHNLELSASTAGVLLNAEYPEKTLDEMWRTVLVNQFHDIVPGSSIKDVYDDAEIEFSDFFNKGSVCLNSTLDTLLDNVKTDSNGLVYNPNPFEISGVINVEGKSVYVEKVPALGWTSVNPTHTESVTSGNGVIENDVLKVTLNENGEITSILDKRNGREIVERGKVANRLKFYEDRPRYYDAWEVSCFYTQKHWGIENVESIEYFTDGAVGGVRIKSRYKNSTITQEITISHASSRIDFKTHVDWHEDHILLRTHFPTTIRSDVANYEIQYGHLSRPTHRNTTWEDAKFEVCGHKWADLSEYGCGVALINDCKYGYSVRGGDISLSLLKSATQPNPAADQGEHIFTYSLFVHNGDFKGAGVVREANLLNNPLIYKKVSGNGTLPESYSFASSSNPAAVIESVKKAENGDDTVIRLYEAHNSKAATTITLGFEVKKAYLCDLEENVIDELPVTDNKISLTLSNFEIVTLRLQK